jgi:Holliday junction resolvase-like predicted endonuclease
VGRPSKLSRQRHERIIAALREGNYFSTASAPYAAFAAAVKKARAEAEAQALRQVRQAAAEGTWQAAAWYLERAHSERWGRVRGDVVTLETVRQLTDELVDLAMSRMDEQAQHEFAARLRAAVGETNGHGLRVVVAR